MQYSLDVLQVEHVIVCGHYGCGGVAAAMENKEFGLVDNWLRHIKDVYSKHRKEVDALGFRDQKLNRLCELNVIQQVHNLSKTKVVQRAWREGRKLTLHGWVYSLSNGLIKDLKVDVSQQNMVEDIYWMAPDK